MQKRSLIYRSGELCGGQSCGAAAPVSELIYEHRFSICLRTDKRKTAAENANGSANIQKSAEPADSRRLLNLFTTPASRRERLLTVATSC